MTAVIDTHALSWHLSRPSRLGKAARALLAKADAGASTVLIPAIVLVELCLLRDAGRKVVGIAEIEALLAHQPSFRVVPLDPAQAREFSLLGAVGDPFDRMIIAAARATGAPLITADTEIEESKLASIVWD